MQVEQKSKENDNAKNEVDNLKRRLKELEALASKLRKKGIEADSITTRLYTIPPKIMVANATLAKADIDKAKTALDQLEREASELEATIEKPKE